MKRLLTLFLGLLLGAVGWAQGDPGGAVSFTVRVSTPLDAPAPVLIRPQGMTTEQRLGVTGRQLKAVLPEEFDLIVRPDRDLYLPYIGHFTRQMTQSWPTTGLEVDAHLRHVSVLFDLVPEDSRIYLEGTSSDKTAQGEKGYDTNPLLLDRLEYLKPDGNWKPLKLRFARPGYQDKAIELQLGSLKNLKADRFAPNPPDNVIHLEPGGSPLDRMHQLGYLHKYRTGMMVTIDLLLVGALLAIPLWAIPARRQRERERTRLAVIDGYESKFTGEDPNLGKVLGAYRLVGRLGAGGMAVVYKAIPESELANGPEAAEKAAVAIKLMNQEYTEDPDFRRRFDREVQVCQELDHRNVVRLVDWGQEGGALYMVMELVDGQTLGDILDEQKALEPQEFLTYMEGICQGLNHSHKKGIVHRDLKPSNIMVTKNGLIKIMDLGLAKGDRSDHKVTQTGDALGTLAYMPPEQFTGGVVTPYADQYSLGVMAYEMLSGRLPFESDGDPMGLVMKHLNEPPIPVREWKPNLSEELDAAVLKMIAKEPSSRHKNIQAAYEALQAAIG